MENNIQSNINDVPLQNIVKPSLLSEQKDSYDSKQKVSNTVLPTPENPQHHKFPTLFFNEQESLLPKYTTVDVVFVGVPRQNNKNYNKPGTAKEGYSKQLIDKHILDSMIPEPKVDTGSEKNGKRMASYPQLMSWDRVTEGHVDINNNNNSNHKKCNKKTQ